MNCPRCKAKLETVTLGVTGVADFWIDDDGIVELDRNSSEVEVLLDGKPNPQECPHCGHPFSVVAQLERGTVLPRFIAKLKR